MIYMVLKIIGGERDDFHGQKMKADANKYEPRSPNNIFKYGNPVNYFFCVTIISFVFYYLFATWKVVSC